MTSGRHNRFGFEPLSPRHGRDRRAPWRGAAIRWFASALLVLGCGDERPGATGGDDANPTPLPADVCATPNVGCACEDEGQLVACGVTQEKTNEYVVCQHGSRACIDGSWGACELDGQTNTLSLSIGPGQRHALG